MNLIHAGERKGGWKKRARSTSKRSAMRKWFIVDNIVVEDVFEMRDLIRERGINLCISGGLEFGG